MRVKKITLESVKTGGLSAKVHKDELKQRLKEMLAKHTTVETCTDFYIHLEQQFEEEKGLLLLLGETKTNWKPYKKQLLKQNKKQVLGGQCFIEKNPQNGLLLQLIPMEGTAPLRLIARAGKLLFQKHKLQLNIFQPLDEEVPVGKINMDNLDIDTEEEELGSPPPEELKVYAKQLQPLLKYTKLTSWNHTKWAKRDNNYKILAQQEDLLKAIEALDPKIVSDYIKIYKEHRKKIPKAERKVYQVLCKAAEDYEDIKTSIVLVRKYYAVYDKLSTHFVSIANKLRDLGLSKTEEDFYVLNEAQIKVAQQFLDKLNTLKEQLKKLPLPVFKTFQSSLLSHTSSHILYLKGAMLRNTTRLESAAFQPIPYPNAKHANFSPQKLQGPVFATPKPNKTGEQDIASNDAMQGSIGDCYLISSLIGVATKYPKIIRDAITEIPKNNGVVHYQVSLYVCTSANDTTLKKQTVAIDNTFMVKNGKPVYAALGDQKELWPLIIEKAMAKLLGGYKLLEGGSTSWVLKMLTGKVPTNKRNTSFKNVKDLFAFLEANKNKLITVGTKSVEEVKKYNEKAEAVRKKVAVGTAKPPVYQIRNVKSADGLTENNKIIISNNVIYCGHAYYVSSFSANSIKLINPHNTSEPLKKTPTVPLQFILDGCTNITAV